MVNLIIPIVLIVLLLPSFALANEINIGLSLSLSGKYSKMGTMQRNGFRLWESLTNKRGGILNRKVILHIQNDKSDPELARKIYKDLIENKRVDLVFGPYSSGISKAILSITEHHRFPVLLSGASADSLWEQNYKYAFGVYTPASKYTVGFLEMLTRNKIRNIAILSANNPFSRSLSASTKNWAEKFRLNIVLFEQLQPENDFIKALTKARETGAQAVVMCGYLKEAIAVVEALTTINWQPKAFYGSVGPATDAFYQALGDRANLTFSSSQWEPTVGVHFPRGKEFIETFNTEFQQAPSYHAATAFAAGMILQAAVDITGSIEREKLKNTFSSMDTTTLIGRYGVDKTGWQIRHFPLIIQWQNGKKRVVWPEKLKNADPVFN